MFGNMYVNGHSYTFILLTYTDYTSYDVYICFFFCYCLKPIIAHNLYLTRHLDNYTYNNILFFGSILQYCIVIIVTKIVGSKQSWNKYEKNINYSKYNFSTNSPTAIVLLSPKL